LRKLESVGLQAEQHLHDSLPICDHMRRVHSTPLLRRHVNEVSLQGDALALGLLPLDTDYLVDGVDDVEALDILPEFASLNLGVVE